MSMAIVTDADVDAAWAEYWKRWPALEQATRQQADKDYRRGRILYRLGYSDSQCATCGQQRGWWDACQADAEAHPKFGELFDNVDWDDMEVGE